MQLWGALHAVMHCPGNYSNFEIVLIKLTILMIMDMRQYTPSLFWENPDLPQGADCSFSLPVKKDKYRVF